MTWALNTFQQTVLCGAGSLNELSGHLQLFGHERVVLVSSRRAPVDLVRASLGDAQVVMEVADVEAHSPLSRTRELAVQLAESPVDAVIAVGGGSVIDTAKALAVLLAGQEPSFDLGPGTGAVAVISVPTTLAGAEFTPVGAYTADNAKSLFVDRTVAARITVYDPALLAEMPNALLATTGMNGLAHCLEAALSVGTNPIALALATTGAAAFGEGLRTLASGTRDEKLLVRLQQAAVLGGLAVTAGSAGVHHAVCHVLGGSHDVPHGAANAAFLPYALEYNVECSPDVQASLLSALNGDSGGAKTLVAAVTQLQEQLGVVSSLQEFGLDRADLPTLAAATCLDPTAHYNPRPVTAEDLLPTLERAWEGALR